MKKELCIYVDWFWPAYRAGGPVQSLVNLCRAVGEHCTIHIVTSAYDLNENETLPAVKTGCWQKAVPPGHSKAINVWYGSGASDLALVHRGKDPAVLYLNGIYSWPFFLKPLLFRQRIGKNARLVVCPRGMLQPGALAVKPLKKKLYLFLLRFSGLAKNIHWHATTEEEAVDIQKQFGQRSRITVAPNIPKPPVALWTPAKKQRARLKLVYLSLISEKKNLLLLLDALQQTAGGVTLDIYGPVKDRAYWKKCEAKLEQLNGKACYRGELEPQQVQDTFRQYDASILLTKGENFGHALYESLGAARPVITSYFTPWKNLQPEKAGWNVDISNVEGIVHQINELAQMNKPDFDAFCAGAHHLASTYYNRLDPVGAYKELFSIH